MSSLRVGNHVNKDGAEMPDAIQRDIKLAAQYGVTMNLAQIFVIGPRNTRDNLSQKDKDRLLPMSKNVDVYVHGSYLDNPWGRKAQLGASLIKREINICEQIGARGLIIHLARKNPQLIAERVAEFTRHCINTRLFLEIESYRPEFDGELNALPCTFEMPQKIKVLVDELESRDVDFSKVGICVDTAHLWSAGVNIKRYDDAKTWIDAFDSRVQHVILHFNDQVHALGSGRDAHAPLLYGSIWGDVDYSESGARAFVEWQKPMILERKHDTPKINEKPECSNIVSDYKLLAQNAV